METDVEISYGVRGTMRDLFVERSELSITQKQPPLFHHFMKIPSLSLLLSNQQICREKNITTFKQHDKMCLTCKEIKIKL
jgi:hypothetical protein